MKYEELVEKAQKRTLTEEDAKNYLGKDLVKIIEWIKALCKSEGYNVYVHGTNEEAAMRIVKRGYNLYHEDISENRIPQKFLDYFETAFDNPSNELYHYDKGDAAERVECDIFDSYNNTIIDSESGCLSQHFTYGFPSYCGLVSRFIAHNFGYPCEAMCIFAFPQNEQLENMMNNVYTCSKNIFFNSYSYSVREVLNPLFCIGYLDIVNKKMVFNKQFGIHAAFNDRYSIKSFKEQYEEERAIDSHKTR